MLEPREADIPALFLVFVVLPLLAYVLLGKWSEGAKKTERVSLLAQLASEEALRAEAMTVADVLPPVSVSKGIVHACARCSRHATTRCSRCKSVRYCSGKCQIMHWREVHRQTCLQLQSSSAKSSLLATSNGESFHNDIISSPYFECGMEQIYVNEAPAENIMYSPVYTGIPNMVQCASVDPSHMSMLENRTEDKKISRKSKTDLLRQKSGVAFDPSEDWTNQSTFNNVVSKEPSNMESILSDAEAIMKKYHASISDPYINEQSTSGYTVHENHKFQGQDSNIFESRSNSGSTSSSYYSSKSGADSYESGSDFVSDGEHSLQEEKGYKDVNVEFKSSEISAVKGNMKAKRAPYSLATKVPKSSNSTVKDSTKQYCSEIERKGQHSDDSKVAKMKETTSKGSNGMVNSKIMKMTNLKKPKNITRQEIPEINGYRYKTKVLFPYDEFVKYFQCEIFELTPRGLLNCGNSCYANAVLQCLTCTKPLIIYLLRRSHSRACCGKDWCLMCELEQYVMLLRESVGALSPRQILFHMRSINRQMGDGSQEDAHEFLRLLVTSMQSICLEGMGGETKVDPRLQETTFIQHTFGGHLRSKVKCLSCHHESVRYENIMDLTLEIYGWVESLEDALTQFTTPEDLDGENMYRCGRCAAYVRARKQLCIHEAPNILTIVLKRFQEGRYGKINKCITFPEMLDMIPYMTGTGDTPPLYLLYAVVVHLDTQNASFSGHYVAYVKDMQGNWYKIDDTEVHPVSMSQVMMEGAYILFYMRSCPRPQKGYGGKTNRQQDPNVENASLPKGQRLKPSQNIPVSQYVSPEHSPGVIWSETSSDWSIFTSSDEASFTTESTRDSFSTVDHADAGNMDPISSTFNILYAPEHSRGSVNYRKVLKQ